MEEAGLNALVPAAASAAAYERTGGTQLRPRANRVRETQPSKPSRERQPRPTRRAPANRKRELQSAPKPTPAMAQPLLSARPALPCCRAETTGRDSDPFKSSPLPAGSPRAAAVEAGLASGQTGDTATGVALTTTPAPSDSQATVLRSRRA